MPERRPINIKPREMPFDQIVQVRGRNPIGEALPAFGKAIGDAMVQREQLRKLAQQTSAIETATGAQPGAYAGMGPDQALRVAEFQNKLKEQMLKANKLDTAPIPVTRRGNGYVNTFSDEPIVYDPNQRYQEFKDESGRFEIGDRNAELRRDTNIAQIVKSFTIDASVKKSQQALDASGDIRALVDSGNPIAANAVPTYAARMAGEVGALSEADKQPFGGSQAILQRVYQSFEQMSNGTLTEDNKQFLRELTDVIKGRAVSKIATIARKRAGQYGGTFGNSAEDWHNRFMSEYQDQIVPPALPQQPTPQQTGERKAVGRWNPQTGRVEMY